MGDPLEVKPCVTVQKDVPIYTIVVLEAFKVVSGTYTFYKWLARKC